MAGSKRNKIKKILSPVLSPPATNTTVDDEQLMDDLFAQLDSRNSTVQGEAATVINDIQAEQSGKQPESASGKQNSKSRHKARQEKKAAALAESYAPIDPAADARLAQEAADEEKTIKRLCDDLSVFMYEITPDGHCLFSAVADQLQILGILPQESANYSTVRRAAADYIATHPDDFLPFIPSTSGEDTAGATSDTGFMSPAEFERYCATIRNTGAWGGEPEILALSRAYQVPIHVIQSGTPPVVVHNPFGEPLQEDLKGKHVVRISYHRRMYGLGEHYNSLRPKMGLTNSIKSLFNPSQ